MIKKSNTVYNDSDYEVNARITLILFNEFPQVERTSEVLTELRQAFKHSKEPLSQVRRVVTSYVEDPFGPYFCPMSKEES